ncbi:hypothetical protein NMY22_g5077 [Coprinellus aureogranulatus]|nr:hypothetical protein NMY22_g5077 [Coprinellus aureogranulatus]
MTEEAKARKSLKLILNQLMLGSSFRWSTTRTTLHGNLPRAPQAYSGLGTSRCMHHPARAESTTPSQIEMSLDGSDSESKPPQRVVNAALVVSTHENPRPEFRTLRVSKSASTISSPSLPRTVTIGPLEWLLTHIQSRSTSRAFNALLRPSDLDHAHQATPAPSPVHMPGLGVTQG